MTRRQFHLVAAAGVLLLVLAPALLSPFSITLMNFIGIYALAVLGLVLLSGIGGMLSFGQAAFVGIAAYATAWLTVKAGYSPWIGLVVGVVLTGLVAAILGAVTLRLGRNSCTQAARSQAVTGRDLISVAASNCMPRNSGSEVVLCGW